MPHRQITTMRSNQPRRTDRQPAALRLLVVGSSRGTLSFQIAPRFHKLTQIRVICYKNQLSLAVIFCRYLVHSYKMNPSSKPVISKFTIQNVKVVISDIMLWVHLSIWNYVIYWWKREKFILAMYSVSYKISYKIVIMTCNIIIVRLGNPWVGIQNANRFLRGRSCRATNCRFLRRSDIILITSPFVLRPCS